MEDAAFPVASAPGMAISCPRCVGLVQPSLQSRGDTTATGQPGTNGEYLHGKGTLAELPLVAAAPLHWQLGGRINELQNNKHPVLLSVSGAG